MWPTTVRIPANVTKQQVRSGVGGVDELELDSITKTKNKQAGNVVGEFGSISV